jgi:multidrug resistance efflux pump
LAEPQLDLQAIGNLLQIEHEVRLASSMAVIEFIATNDTWRIVPYRQAALWRIDSAGRAQLQLVSGLADLGGDSPYRQWFNQVLASQHFTPGKAQRLHMADLPADLHEGWREWMPNQVVALPFVTPPGSSNGGLWLALEHEAADSEIALLERLAAVYGQALWAWRDALPWWQRAMPLVKRLLGRKWLWLALLLTAAVPMRLTVLAPAEIIGKDAKPIAAPFEGVIAQFYVTPNQTVTPGMPLFALDDTNTRNRNEVATQARKVAEAEYLRTTQKAFSDLASKAELAGLKAKMDEKSAEADYTRELLARGQVSAPEAGIVVFSDPNDWLGRPVQTGERIMQLADPSKVQIAIRLPVDDALNLEPGARVKLYLNVAPLAPLDAELKQASYEPTPVAEGFVAYHLKADLSPSNGGSVPRIGLKGTAKIYGDWAPLIYHVLRKPLAWCRRTLGV